MSKILRKTQLVFGADAGLNQISQYGSLAAGSAAYSVDPAVIQALSNYLTGWFGAVVGGNSPAIEDMNALCYLFAYQLAYGFQAGVPEWDAGTTYYTGSMATSDGVIYVSLTDTNLNNAVTDATNWKSWGFSRLVETSTTPYTITNTDVLSVDATAGAKVVNLPTGASSVGRIIRVRKSDTSENGVTITPNGADTIDGAATKVIFDANACVSLIGKSGGWLSL